LSPLNADAGNARTVLCAVDMLWGKVMLENV